MRSNSAKKRQRSLLLVKTHDEIKSKKIINLILTNKINVQVSLYRSLNSSKGVIYNKELINVRDDEILED